MNSLCEFWIRILNGNGYRFEMILGHDVRNTIDQRPNKKQGNDHYK